MLYFLILIIIIYVLFKFKVDTKQIKKTKPSISISGYNLFYTDQKNVQIVDDVIYSKIIHSEKYDLKGKPDYIFVNNKRDDLVPIELKSGQIGEKDMPYKGDLMQLVAYFLIIEDVFDISPKEGRLIYKDHMFIIKNTKKLQNELINVLKDMRNMLVTGEDESNASYVTCKHCMCRDTVCEFCSKK